MTNPAILPDAVRMQDICKSFGPVHANRNASLTVATAEIHALVGENGAGKSTLMRILGGLITPDAGTLEVAGRDVTGWSTRDAIAAGVGVVHQHFMLVPTLTVAENLVLGKEPMKGGRIDYDRAVADVGRIGKETGLAIDGTRLVADLSVGEAQRVEILKTLYRGAKILVLDEPTAVLSPPEVRELAQVLRRVRENGGTVIIITHRLDEVMALSDRITVMRAGETVALFRTAETNSAEIAQAMVGRHVRLTTRELAVVSGEALQPAAGTDAAATPATAAIRPVQRAGGLVVRNLVVAGSRKAREVDNVSFSVRPGEILGIAGVEGNGQSELIEALAGLRAITSGTVNIANDDVTRASPRAHTDAGISHIPEDRQRRGLVMDYSVAENLILGMQHRFAPNGVLDREAIATYARDQIRAFDIRPDDPSLPVRSLSGGNQQKVVVAREMGGGRDYSVLLASQPTRGVDVGAIEFIHARLIAARDAGKAVVLVSAELNEVLSLADRVAVMCGGKFVVVMPASEATEELLGEYMTGARAAA
ncbi:MAG: ABC transporter ATP-binding protein [Gemmatimonadota bacterium]|nr:ABC transporter ATP-binding protein [Gemmatimonadota bacterium]